MTNERAVEILSDEITRMIKFKADMNTIDAMEIGMSALRQRIHKEVIYGKTRSRDGKVIKHHAIATCPECYKTIAEWYDSWEAPYCSGCGQALSWKEKKDE